MQRFFAFVLRAALAAACLALFAPGNAQAADYPTRQPHIYVGYPPGGSTDILARLFGDWIGKRLGQQFIIENRPGAGNNLATEFVSKAAPDGYSLILVNPANAVNASLYKHLNFVFLRDIDPVGGFIRVPNVMEVNPSVPVKTVTEFIAYVKANPDKVNVASSGNGTSIHLSGELFKMMTGTKMTHVPYKGSAPMLTDLLGGQVQVTFDNLPSSIEHIKAGKLRALAVTTASRLDALPDVPTVADFVPGYEASGFAGIGAPRNTPADIIDMLNKELNAGLADSKIRAQIVELGGTVLGGSPAEFGTILAEATEKWAKVIKFAGIKVD
jgi:tripartite-type tricarboxylate transporter receptor subunit TctC